MINIKALALLTFLISLQGLNLQAQNVEIDGTTKITVMDTVTDVSGNVVRKSDGTLALRQYKIGDLAQGGIVFYVDESGEHGLVADLTDVSAGVRWYAGTSGSTQAKGDGVFAGEMNTAIIISSHVAISDDGQIYAARMCAELEKGGYADWYLPSLHELNLMYENLADTDGDNSNSGPGDPNNIGGFENALYWSSTELSIVRAYGMQFGGGLENVNSKSISYRVRAIRAF
ncbi:Lcl domain-containing protein [Portibacter marinus]|uniref:Lcl domain-containing protein n=1 Tax=Portibacter marinus TaxID=2898660 RepID=UPI001F2A50E8|nr:DUF1566 domain-containing protein [Portibacter marinus]